MSQGRYVEALADFALSTLLDPDDGWKWHFYGVGLYFANRFIEAAETFAKVRTRKKALDRMVQKLKEDMSLHGLKRLAVHYIGDKAPALEWAKSAIWPLVGHETPVLPVSPVLGVHVGPAVGIAYECNSPIEGKLTVPYDEYIFAMGV